MSGLAERRAKATDVPGGRGAESATFYPPSGALGTPRPGNPAVDLTVSRLRPRCSRSATVTGTPPPAAVELGSPTWRLGGNGSGPRLARPTARGRLARADPVDRK